MGASLTTDEKYLVNRMNAVSSKVQLATKIADLGEFKDVTLTTAQLLALFTTPVSVLPAPGAGYANIVTAVYGSISYNSATYSGANNIVLKYTDASGVTVATFTAAFLNSSASAGYLAIGASGVAAANAAIVASMGTANPTVGDSALKLRIYYRKVALPM